MNLPNNVERILSGHHNQETAFVQDDYPYGRMRCTRRVWLEKGKQSGMAGGQVGYRMVTQTINPKTGRENAPKKSTYCPFAAALYLDDKGHVQWSGMTIYSDASEAEAWIEKFWDGLDDEMREQAGAWLEARQNYERRKAEREAAR